MEPISGNACLFCLFKTCSLALFLVGLLDMGSGIAVCIEASDFSWYNGGFILLGSVLVLLAIFAFQTRYSSGKILCYLFLLVPCFLAQVGFTLGIILYTDYDNKLNGESNANIVRYILLGACGVVLVCGVLGWCYRSSIQKAKFYQKLERDHPLMPKSKNKKQQGPSKHDKIKDDLR